MSNGHSPLVGFDSRRYLEQALPALLGAPDASEAEGVEVDAVIQFEVTDLDGYRVHYHFHEGRLDVLKGEAPRVDLAIEIASAELLALSRNTLNTQVALKTSRLKVTGDDRLLLWLADRLAPDSAQ